MLGVSISLFGSQARGTTDSLSDRDVLVVGVDSCAVQEAAAPFAADGWNISSFTRNAFQDLARTRCLFIQHLKLESISIRDDQNYLTNILWKFRPRLSYSGERNDALAFLLSLPRPSGNYWHDLCLADASCVFLRNAMITHLATEGLYIFDFAEMAQAISERLNLPQEHRRCLHGLRGLKRAYRNRMTDHDPAPSVDTARLIAARFLRLINDCSESSIGKGITTDAYFRLRLRELHLVEEFDPRVLDRIQYHEPLHDVWKQIMGGREYKDKLSALPVN